MIIHWAKHLTHTNKSMIHNVEKLELRESVLQYILPKSKGEHNSLKKTDIYNPDTISNFNTMS